MAPKHWLIRVWAGCGAIGSFVFGLALLGIGLAPYYFENPDKAPPLPVTIIFGTIGLAVGVIGLALLEITVFKRSRLIEILGPIVFIKSTFLRHGGYGEPGQVYFRSRTEHGRSFPKSSQTHSSDNWEARTPSAPEELPPPLLALVNKYGQPNLIEKLINALSNSKYADTARQQLQILSKKTLQTPDEWRSWWEVEREHHDDGTPLDRSVLDKTNRGPEPAIVSSVSMNSPSAEANKTSNRVKEYEKAKEKKEFLVIRIALHFDRNSCFQPFLG